MIHRTPARDTLVYVQLDKAVALDPATGAHLWTYRAEKNLVRFLFAEERLFLLDADCFVHCLVTATGSLIGRVAAGPATGYGAAMVVVGDRLVVATTNGVACLSSEGALLWRHDDEKGAGPLLPGLGVAGQVMQPDYNS
jgi:outer membrane protein assembly factor BamB